MKRAGREVTAAPGARRGCSRRVRSRTRLGCRGVRTATKDPSGTPGCSGLSWGAVGRPATPVLSSHHPGAPQAASGSPPPHLPNLSLSLYCRTKPSFPLHGGEVPRARASFVMVSAAPVREQLRRAGVFSQPARERLSHCMCTLVL